MNAFSSLEHRGSISMMKMSKITIEITKEKILLFYFVCSTIHVSITVSLLLHSTECGDKTTQN
jgi:hypothetical protein